MLHGAVPANAHAATYLTNVYNWTVVGSDWGEDGNVKSAKLPGNKLKLGKGSINRGYEWIGLPKGKTYKLAKSCKFYNASGRDGSYRFSKKESRSNFKKTLKKANKIFGRGRYNSHHYALLFKTKKGKVTKLGIMKNPEWTAGY